MEGGMPNQQIMRDKERHDPKTRIDLVGVAMQVKRFERKEIIYSQGERGSTLLYIEDGSVKLSATTGTGKEAVVAILGRSDFFGEKCLSGCLVRRTTATAIAPSTLVVIRKNEMRRVLLTKHPFCNVFISYLLAMSLQTEEDLINSLCNRSEVRLARVLLRLADKGDHNNACAFEGISQGTLARMIGTTRSRVNFFMNSFRQRGFISYGIEFDGALWRNDGLRINSHLLETVV
jgi:CRP/FNR family cyclic AMP-dependent transcriptional regulator